MRRKVFLTVFALASSVLGGLSGAGLVRAGSPATCGQGRVAGFTQTSAVARGQGLAVASGGAISVVNGDVRTSVAAPVAGGVIKQVSSRSGFGTAYVDDLNGPDTVVALTPSGVVRLPQPGEAMQPSWSSAGDLVWSLGTELGVRWAAGGTGRISAPSGASMVFSPTFAGAHGIVAVASEPVANALTHDDALNNLYRYDLRSRKWLRLTDFSAGADRWSVIRIPVLVGDGSIEFVLVRGRASTTEQATYELWQLSGRVATEIRVLPREMYLAGFQDGRRFWNVYDPSIRDWRLFREESNGRLTDLGCGAAQVDPLAQPDPDKEGTSGLAPPRTNHPGLEMHDGSSTAPVGVLVGDFGTRSSANEAARSISDAYAGGAEVEVVDSADAPEAVRPGVWAVVMRLAPDADVEQALQDFRARLPQYAASSWMVTL